MLQRFLGYFLRSINNERGILPLLLAGGAIASGLGAYLGRGKTVTDPYGALSPEAKSMYQAAAPGIQANATATPESFMYKGDFTAPMTQGEQDLVSQNSRLSAVSQPTWETLMNPLDTSGELGSAMNNYYRDSIYNPTMKAFQEDVAPQIEEQYAGSGGYWGGARADAVRGAYGDIADTLASKRSELAWNSLMNAGNAANQYADYATKSAGIQAIPRNIAQYGLDQKYKDYVQANETSQKYIDQALNFLNIDTVTQTTKSTGGVWPYLLGAAGNAMMMGGAMGGASGASSGLNFNQAGASTNPGYQLLNGKLTPVSGGF